jgi:hypothetical protein
MKEATVAETAVAEAPKTKKGTKAETTTVEGAEPKTRKAAQPKNGLYRLIHGVSSADFRGQRQIVVKALESLGAGHHPVEKIVEKSDGLVSKTPVEASVKYHLRGLLEDGKVEEIVPAPAPVAEKPAA